MTGLSLALANLKPGTGKTTSAVWLAHVFAQAGNSVLLVDADPAGSALGHQIVRPLWLDLQEEMMKRLDSLTLDELCGRAHRAGIAGRATEYTDFEI